MALEKETQLEAWLEENMPEPGGGNPNYIETIDGTIANPWGNYSASNLAKDYKNKNITVYMSTSHLYVPANITLVGFRRWYTIIEIGNNVVGAALLSYGTNGQLIQASAHEYVDGNYTETTIDPNTPCTLTIIHHPLPEN